VQGVVAQARAERDSEAGDSEDKEKAGLGVAVLETAEWATAAGGGWAAVEDLG